MDNLVNNYYFLKRLVPALFSHLKERTIAEVYAQNKHEYVFQLDKPGQGEALVFYFGNRVSFAFLDTKAKPRSGAPPYFQAIHGKRITNVQVMANDRSFVVSLSGAYHLLFKLYGVHGNVILFEGEDPQDTIRKKLQQDQKAQLSTYHQELDQSFEAYRQALDDGAAPREAIDQLFPTFTKDFHQWLIARSFSEEAGINEQWQALQHLLTTVNTCSIHLHYEENEKLDDTGYRLSFFEGETLTESFSDPLTAVNRFASLFLRKAQLLYYKQILTSHWQKEIKQHKKRVKSFSNNLQKLVEGYDYQQLADIIMANLHRLEKGMTEAILYDFYHDQHITIGLKQFLSPQANAERLYKKAKNQSIELATAEQNLEREQERLALAQAEYQQALEETDFKKLKQQYQQLLQKQKPRKPSDRIKDKFKHFKVQGYDLYVGKGAAINDLLTFQFARKEDLWLHTREQKGAHVIIRSGKGQSIPDDVLESAAQLAAYYAKRKGESFTPVVYTRKKYVWKPSGGETGQVHYKNEELMMVEPAMPAVDT